MTDMSMQQPAEKKKDGRAKPKKFHVDREWFERVYVVERLETRYIAKEIGCVNEHVTAIAKKFGIAPRGKLKRTVPFPRLELDNEEIVRLYVEEKMSAADIGKLMGCTHRPIAARLVEMGVVMRHHNDTKRGAKSKNRIEIDPDAVVEMYSIQYVSAQAVADHFGVSRGVIGRILKETGTPIKRMGDSRDWNGDKHPMWREDLTEEERQQRRDMHQQKLWRLQVYARDNYTCQKCGDSTGGNLNAHHIVPHSADKTVAWDLDNGITMCKPCHMGFHRKYGYTKCTRADLEAFLA